ncbi:hypothetical protein PIROE2DRAFT_18217 [Piromyces sp. E2]|nr:hypothetical protein PIROE2DRAFT_18217 [Piromyces sp. E2]|eukprot:OUM56954.1 hypothetical protein PIROE2DRAFT_18217 [Piromyces sp. E2]
MKLLNIIGLLIFAGSTLATCDEDLPKYQACSTKAATFTKFKSKEEVETYCKSFEAEECKDFLKIVSTPTECIKDPSKLPVVALYQLPYLAYCSKKEDNTDCPITAFIKENFSDFDKLDVTNISDKLKEAVANDCKDTACNKRMLTIGESMKEPTIEASAPSVFGETYKFYNGLYESYKNNVCDLNDKDKNNDEKDAAYSLNIISYSFIGMILLYLTIVTTL